MEMYYLKKYKKVKGFVMNRYTGHTSYAYRQNNDIITSIGFTHNKKDKSHKVKLKHNINPNDNKDCYAKTKVEIQRYNTYRSKPEYSNYRIHKDDRNLIYKIANSNKKRRY